MAKTLSPEQLTDQVLALEFDELAKHYEAIVAALKTRAEQKVEDGKKGSDILKKLEA